MRKINLPDGWYRIPGDGSNASYPHSRRSKFRDDSNVYNYCAKIENGIIVKLPGMTRSELPDTSTMIDTQYYYTSPEFLAEVESVWGVSLAELLGPQEEAVAANKKASDLPVFALTLLGGHIAVALVKNLARKANQSSVGRIEKHQVKN